MSDYVIAEPDQIDMMSAAEVRKQFRDLIKHHVNSRVELAQLRAKVEALDKGEEMLEAVKLPEGVMLVHESEKEYMEQSGYTCRKVRVCEEVEG